MRIADREIALSMMFLDEREVSRFLNLVAPVKAQRVREELALQKHRVAKYEVYQRAVANVIAQLESSRSSPSLHSYLRPHSRRGSRPSSP